MPERTDRPPTVAIGPVEARGKASGTAHRSLGGRVAQGIADGAAAVPPPRNAARIYIASLKLRLQPDADRGEVARRLREAMAAAMREREGRR